jgi:hypothetical protein
VLITSAGKEPAHRKRKESQMAKSAAYLPLGDKTFTLQNGHHTAVVFKFDAPDVDAGRKSVLSFVADPFGDNTVSIEWDLNGTNILTHLFDTPQARVLQEIVGQDLLKAQGNELKVRVTDTDGSGSIKIGDVVLLYTQDA